MNPLKTSKDGKIPNPAIERDSLNLQAYTLDFICTSLTCNRAGFEKRVVAPSWERPFYFLNSLPGQRSSFNREVVNFLFDEVIVRIKKRNKWFSTKSFSFLNTDKENEKENTIHWKTVGLRSVRTSHGTFVLNENKAFWMPLKVKILREGKWKELKEDWSLL